MKKFLLAAAIAICSAPFGNALIKNITDGNFVFEIDTDHGTAALLKLVNNKVAELTVPAPPPTAQTFTWSKSSAMRPSTNAPTSPR